MTVESVTHISDLNVSYPGAGDSLVEGDDHIRNIKTALKTDFANINAAVTATPTQLNNIGMFLIASSSASASATIDFTTGIDSTYEEYELHIVDAVPATDDVSAWIRTSTDAGSTFAATAGDYDYITNALDSAAATTGGSGGTATSLVLSGRTVDSATAYGGISGVVRFFNPAGTTHNKRFQWMTSHSRTATNTAMCITTGAGQRTATADIDAIRFMFSSGNIASGKFKLYGIRKS